MYLSSIFLQIFAALAETFFSVMFLVQWSQCYIQDNQEEFIWPSRSLGSISCRIRRCRSSSTSMRCSTLRSCASTRASGLSRNSCRAAASRLRTRETLRRCRRRRWTHGSARPRNSHRGRRCSTQRRTSTSCTRICEAQRRQEDRESIIEQEGFMCALFTRLTGISGGISMGCT